MQSRPRVAANAASPRRRPRLADTSASVSSDLARHLCLARSRSTHDALSRDATVWPFKVNGVPLRRVNQSYVIATSTKVDSSGVNLEKFSDSYFANKAEKKNKKGEGEFFEAVKEENSELPPEKREDQKAVDAVLIKAIDGVADLKTYLAARFSLKSGMKPHELIF